MFSLLALLPVAAFAVYGAATGLFEAIFSVALRLLDGWF